jgi:lysophospholipase L1-like esterase
VPHEGVLLSLGDCNTQGIAETESSAYPVLLARRLGVPVRNCGLAMATIREGWEHAQRQLSADTAYLTIQFGLVDSWLTFRGAPYVLYYPDNPGRRLLRKLVKRIKKSARKLGIHKWLGEAHVVSPEEYQAQLIAIIQLARQRSPDVRIALIATAPTVVPDRNPGIEKFNSVMRRVAEEQQCHYIDGYSPFVGKPELILDSVHLNREAHATVAELCRAALQSR